MNRFLKISISVLLGIAAMDGFAREHGERNREDRQGSEERRRGDREGREQAPPVITEIQVNTGQPNVYVAPPVNPAPVVRTEVQYQRGDRDGRNQGERYGDRNDNNRGRDQDRKYDGRDRNHYDGRDGRNDRNDRRHDGRGNDRNRYGDRGRDYQRWGNRGWNRQEWRRDWRHGWSGSRQRANSRYYYPRGYSARTWSVGYRLPSVFFGASYYLNYDTYGLSQPPYGCQWVRIDSDVVLVEIATGEILEVLNDFYY